LGDFAYRSVPIPDDRELFSRSAVKVAMGDQAETACAIVPYLEAPEIGPLRLNDSVEKILGRGSERVRNI
jgi:hypothetical protein